MRWYSSPRRWIAVGYLVLGAGLLMGLLLFARWLLALPADKLSVADQRASVISALVAVLFGVAGFVASHRLAAGVAAPTAALNSAVDHLAGRLRGQWAGKAFTLGLLDPQPLTITWKPVTREVTSAASQVIPGTGGDLEALAAAFARLDPQQLVIVGEPASGKSATALLLALSLLKNKAGSRERVPMIVSLSSWHPRESLRQWLISRLEEEHPQLMRAEYGKHAPRALVDQDCVLPILDGFDELAKELQGAAMERLAEAAAEGLPFIMTARVEAYREAVRTQGRALAQAAVVRLQPVIPAHAIAFLTAGEIEEVRGRWKSVAKQMRAGRGPLARVLSIPLMVYLARVAYNAPGTEPQQLTRFRLDSNIIQHLYDSYLPALYRDRYEPRQVRRWLGVLARHLEGPPYRVNLAWWQLLQVVPGSRMVLIIILAFTANILFFLQYGFIVGVLVGSVAIRVCGWLTSGLAPRRLHLARLGPKQSLAAVAVGVAVGCAVIPIVEPGHGAPFTVMAVSTVGLTVTVLVGAALSVRSLEESDPVEPRTMLAKDRTALLGIIILVGLATGLRSGVQYNLTRGLLDASRSILLIGLIVSGWMRLGAGWLTFGTARFGLRLRWGLPLRLLAFLEDAHHRGVLRRSGPFYQFRHANLQRYLAADIQPLVPPTPRKPTQ